MLLCCLHPRLLLFTGLITVTRVAGPAYETLAEAEVALRGCLHVQIGMSKHDAERIMGLSLLSETNDFTFGLTHCSINITRKNRVYSVYGDFTLHCEGPLRKLYAAIIRDRPFAFKHCEDVTVKEDPKDGSLTAFNHLIDQNQLTMGLHITERNAYVAIGIYNHLMQRNDNPGFYPIRYFQ